MSVRITSKLPWVDWTATRWVHGLRRGGCALALLVALAVLAACGAGPASPEGRHADHGPASGAGDHSDEHATDRTDAHAAAEARTLIPAAIAAESGIVTAPAAASVIADEHEVQGLLTPREGKVARVTARFPGPIRGLHAGVGDRVRAGQALATIESNLSLSNYIVAAPISGVVLERSATLGETAAEGAALFEIADLSALWVDLHVFGADAGHIVAGSAVTVSRLSDGVASATTVERVLPATATASQSTVARASLENDDGLWRPGSAVRARITVAREPVALAVPLSALQRLQDQDVVFVREGADTYRAQSVTLGRRDAQQVEIRAGLQAGDPVVVAQSYVVKADIEKDEAGHEH